MYIYIYIHLQYYVILYNIFLFNIDNVITSIISNLILLQYDKHFIGHN